MVARPDDDVERALKAFGDLSLKYRSFGAMPLRIGGAPLTDRQPSLDDLGYGILAPTAPASAAETFSLLGSALGEARHVQVAAPRTAPLSGYVAQSSSQSPPPAPPASLTDQALGISGVSQSIEPQRWQAAAAAPALVHFAYDEPAVPDQDPPQASEPPPRRIVDTPEIAKPVLPPPPQSSMRGALEPEVATDILPTIFGRMRVVPAEPSTAIVQPETPPAPDPESEPELVVPAPVAHVAEPLVAQPVLARRAVTPKQPLAGLFRTLSQPSAPMPAPELPDTDASAH